MKFQRLLVPVCLLILTGSVSAQEKKTSQKSLSPNVVPDVRELSFEAAAEKLVRAAYAKLTRYNKAYVLDDDRRDVNIPLEEAYLRFELTNFKVGPIQEILNLPHDEVQTVATEIVQLVRSVRTHNDEDPHLAYGAQWITEQYAPLYNPKWTVNDLFSYDVARYHDVGGYAKYDVTLRLHGKVRSYSAVMLFRNPYGSVDNLKPIVWDIIVGSAGVFENLWYDQRPALGDRPSEKRKSPSQQLGRFPSSKPTTVNDLYASYITQTSSTTPTLGPIVSNTTQDYTEHTEGAHGETIDFQGSCEASSTTQQTCKVNFHFIYVFENGRLKNWVYVHKNMKDESKGTSTGDRGTSITCHSGYGVATKNCLDKSCTFAASLTGSGFNMQMTGGDVWRGQLVHGHTCNIPRPTSGGSGGSGGGCNEAQIQEVKKSRKTSAPKLMNPYCCDSVEQFDCINGGGEWSDSTCSCYSPIVIDVAGNGFNLTNAGQGVMFDLNATGVLEPISWTAAESDDAWLALDRNGNGVIDNGRELFGSSSPQPYLTSGESKNGYRALSMFDETQHGGNGNGQIDAGDAIFTNLRLWRDANHNGISEAGELQGLVTANVEVIELNYKEARLKDENGNWFRYRAKVRDVQGAAVGRWAWDVFLQKMH